MEELGPTFVKLGQILAGRADLFGPELIAEFEKLHSHVPAVPMQTLRPQLRKDLGGEPEAVFARFDTEPVGAASMAQVHRARLHDGTEVIVKIRRPGIDDTIDTDLRLLGRLAALVEAELPALAPYRPRQLVRELARSLRQELDLAGECRNAERIAANVAELPWMVIPAVHWAHTSERVNVQDFIDGVPGPALSRVDELGLDRRLLARRGAQAMLKMNPGGRRLPRRSAPRQRVLPRRRPHRADRLRHDRPRHAPPARRAAAAAAGPGRAPAPGPWPRCCSTGPATITTWTSARSRARSTRSSTSTTAPR